MRQGHVYETFTAKDGRKIILRTLAAGDLRECVRFVNEFVKERASNRDLGVLMDTRTTRKSEGKWLAKNLEAISRGTAFNVAAFHNGRLVGNCGVSRGQFHDTRHSGTLGIAILDGYRGVGLGRRMLQVLLQVSKEGGVPLVELSVLSVNERAIALYRDLGFRKYGSIPGKIRRGGRSIDEVVMFRQA